MPSVRVYGITERSRLEERVPTVAFTVLGTTPREVARKLGERGFFVWDGSYYAVEIIDALKLAASGGAVRVGLVHYNTREEIERFASVLETIAR
jgi:selenocysteine lyase/cysteine desulfurase